MRIKINDLHLLEFYYLILIEAEIINDVGMSQETHDALKNAIKNVIIDFVKESEKIILKQK